MNRAADSCDESRSARLDRRSSAPKAARNGPRTRALVVLSLPAAGMPATAQASIFEGETLDKGARALAGIVLFIAPVIGTRTSQEIPRGSS
jgi:hypothetical protein